MKDNYTNDVSRMEINAECYALSCAMQDPSALCDVDSILSVEMLTDQRNKAILSAMKDIAKQGGSVEMINIFDSIAASGKLKELDTLCGGEGAFLDYLSDVLTLRPSSIDADSFARAVKNKYIIRRMLSKAQKAITAGLGEFADLEEITTLLNDAVRVADEATDNVDTSIQSGLKEVDDKVKFNLSGGWIETFNTGFSIIDGYSGGFHPDEFNVIAAESSHGKTAMALTMLLYMAKNSPCVVYSTEMSKRQVTQRLVSMLTDDVSAKDINITPLSASQLQQYDRAYSYLKEQYLLDIDERANDIDGILSSMRRFIRKKGARVFVIDYLQNLTRPARQNIADYYETVCTELKNFARLNHVCIIMLSQLNRDRDNKSLTNDRLKGSSGIVQAADIVIQILRPSVFSDPSHRVYPKGFESISIEGTALVTCTKNRNGAIFKPFICGYDSNRTLFYDIDQTNLPRAGVMSSRQEENNCPFL